MRGNQGVPSAKQLAAFEKESNIKQESSVNERRRRPDVDDGVILSFALQPRFSRVNVLTEQETKVHLKRV